MQEDRSGKDQNIPVFFFILKSNTITTIVYRPLLTCHSSTKKYILHGVSIICFEHFKLITFILLVSNTKKKYDKYLFFCFRNFSFKCLRNSKESLTLLYYVFFDSFRFRAILVTDNIILFLGVIKLSAHPLISASFERCIDSSKWKNEKLNFDRRIVYQGWYITFCW